MPELLELGQKSFVDRKRIRRKQPILFCEETLRRNGVTNRREPLVLPRHLECKRSTSNAQRPTLNYRAMNRTLNFFYKRFNDQQPSSSTPVLPTLRPISLPRESANRALLCALRFACTRARSERAPLRLLALPRAWEHVRH